MKPVIDNVSDTALWVAVYRANETARSDALFRDPLASQLAGEKGKSIAKGMFGGRFTSWSIVIRTCIIDNYIKEAIASGVDTIINIGAGLDTRPYRLELPSSLRWIEVDFPQMIEFKESKLIQEKPTCNLERVKLDLTNNAERKKFLSRVNSQSKKVFVLTEGVVPYLSNDEASRLATDLREQPNFKFWVLDYFSPEVLRILRSGRRKRVMKNAPFKFAPTDWFQFFEELNWQVTEKRFLGEESLKLGRKIPLPWWAHVLRFIFRPKNKDIKKFSGYFLLEPNLQDVSSPKNGRAKLV